MAEQNAALDAIVDEYAIYVDETELPAILGLSPKDAKTVIDDAREHGGLEEVMAFARRRALEAVVRDASFTEEHETAEQAARRVAEMRAQMQTAMPGDENGSEGEGDKPHLKLV